jgi:hypothetical protein
MQMTDLSVMQDTLRGFGCIKVRRNCNFLCRLCLFNIIMLCVLFWFYCDFFFCWFSHVKHRKMNDVFSCPLNETFLISCVSFNRHHFPMFIIFICFTFLLSCRGNKVAQASFSVFFSCPITAFCVRFCHASLNVQ